ncbi:MAG: helix-turn-helix domain-containing GNAT family N-acetyltransferase [Ilumatobacteraceae bacterium]
MDDGVVAVVRHFNRAHTKRVGALAESFLDTDRPYGPSRVLFEIGPHGTTTRDLRRRLALDSGYLSRMIHRLEREGLVATSVDPHDRRRRIVGLTVAGTAAWHDLDDRSNALVTSLLADLTDSQRDRLADALRTADRLLASADMTVDVVDPTSNAAVTAMTTYFAELDERFGGGFNPGETLVVDAPAMAAPSGTFLVASIGGRVAACGGVQRHDHRTGEIKRMWVDPHWRGVGLGRRMLDRLEVATASLGYSRVVLDTNETLDEAIAMYQRAGYQSTDRYNDNPYAHQWFEKDL